MHRLIPASAVMCVLFAVACIFGESEYEDHYEVWKKSVGTSVEDYFDNGCYIDEIILVPREPSPDRFYIVESPEMLDSVFTSISYSGGDIPRLETLFPEGGSLLILDYALLTGREILEYNVSADQDTITIDMTIRRWLNGPPLQPGFWPVVFPVGFVCSEETIRDFDR